MFLKPEAGVECAVRGVLRRQIFQSADHFYTVAELETHPDSRTVVVAGDLRDCEVGDTVEVQGRWFDSDRYGLRLRALSVVWIPPVTAVRLSSTDWSRLKAWGSSANGAPFLSAPGLR